MQAEFLDLHHSDRYFEPANGKKPYLAIIFLLIENKSLFA